ncbi:MAG: DNA polymerase III subunit delta' [Gammaproteobacteria bacterium]|nr:DNA polymerase III subunit delta' [Gammaproteobacteria bacterium]
MIDKRLKVNNQYPWLSSSIKRLNGYLDSDRVPHGLLISGVAGIGKLELASLFSRQLLCDASAKDGSACGHCHSCSLFESGNHPDFLLIQPEEDSRQILIDAIRTLNQLMTLAPQYTRFRVVIIRLAEQLTTAAANSFLKTLEEPGQRTIFILLSDRPSLVLPTISTRCQHITIPTPSIHVVSQWLEQEFSVSNAKQLAALSGAAPLHAKQLFDSGEYEQKLTVLQLIAATQFKELPPFSITETWVKYSNQFVIYILITGTLDLIRLAMHPEIDVDALFHPDQKQQFEKVASTIELSSLFDYLNQLYRARELTMTHANIQLIYENCYIQWRSIMKEQKVSRYE